MVVVTISTLVTPRPSVAMRLLVPRLVLLLPVVLAVFVVVRRRRNKPFTLCNLASRFWVFLFCSSGFAIETWRRIQNPISANQ